MGDAACRAGVGGGELLGLIEPGHALPVLEHLVEAEAGRAEGGGCFLGQRVREGQHDRFDRFLAFVAGAGLAGEGSASQGGPLLDLTGVGGAVAQGEQGAVEGIGIEIEQAGLFDQCAGLDESACAGLASRVLELGFLFGQPGFLLFERTKALRQ